MRLEIAHAIGQELVDRVSHLVGDRHDITDRIGVIGENVWMRCCCPAHAERTTTLARAQFGVNPAFSKRPPGNASKGAGKLVLSLKHDVLCGRPVVGRQI